MLKREKDGAVWLEFELFQAYPEVVHGTFLKHGGHSLGAYSSMSFGRSSGDCDENVAKNIAKAQSLMGFSKRAWSNLEHKTAIATVNKEGFAGNADVLVTRTPGIVLIVTHADCQAAVFYDPVNRVGANVHAGWRGNVQNIYKCVIEHLHEVYGTQPSNLLVGISPSLGPLNSQFINYRTELPEAFWKHQVKPDYFNLWEISKQQLFEAGVIENHIEIAGLCTYSNPEDFFSYRREKLSGRHGTFFGLK